MGERTVTVELSEAVATASYEFIADAEGSGADVPEPVRSMRKAIGNALWDTAALGGSDG